MWSLPLRVLSHDQSFHLLGACHLLPDLVNVHNGRVKRMLVILTHLTDIKAQLFQFHRLVEWGQSWDATRVHHTCLLCSDLFHFSLAL